MSRFRVAIYEPGKFVVERLLTKGMEISTKFNSEWLFEKEFTSENEAIGFAKRLANKPEVVWDSEEAVKAIELDVSEDEWDGVIKGIPYSFGTFTPFYNLTKNS